MQSLQYDPNWNIKGMNLLEYLHHEIVVSDTYKLRWYKEKAPININTFIDIGANVGVASLFARELFPEARIVAIEPCKDTFQILKENTNGCDIECYNFAYGNGKQMFMERNPFHSGANRFIPNGPEETRVESKTLASIILDLKVKSPYIIKMDIEGGEYFLLNNECDYLWIGNAAHFAIELHFLSEERIKDWDNWIKNSYRKIPHVISKTYTEDRRGATYTVTRKVIQ